MARLCPAIFAIAMLALGSFGCSGQKLEGRWRGPLPYEDAKACVTNLYGNGRFDIFCENAAWVGHGRYSYERDHLRLEYEMLVRQHRAVRHPAPLQFGVVGQGNRLELSVPNAQLIWVRHM